MKKINRRTRHVRQSDEYTLVGAKKTKVDDEKLGQLIQLVTTMAAVEHDRAESYIQKMVDREAALTDRLLKILCEAGGFNG